MESRRRAPVLGGRRGVVEAACAVALLGTLLGPAGGASAGAASVGQGAVLLVPATAPASSAGNTVRMAYIAPALGVSHGVLSIHVPPGWSRPQHRSPGAPGYVSASAGTLRIAGRTIVLRNLGLCDGCSVVVVYADARAPGAGRSTFVTRSSVAAGGPRRLLADQPGITVTGSGPAGGGHRTGAAAVPLGDYAGWVDPSGVAAFGAATGTHPTLATDYLDWSDGWSQMDSASGMGGWAGTGYRLVLAVPMIPGSSGGSLAAGAAGSYDGYFATLAQNLVKEGVGNAILRLGWEFNGTWYPWSVASDTDAANFAAYWRQIVTTMRSVAGQSFQFLWNPNLGGSSSWDLEDAYPGNAYVDYIGPDTYDEYWGSPMTPQNAWSNILGQTWGLDWAASFAASQGKPIAIPEWSVCIRSDGHGMGDDPYFVNQFSAWIASHDVAFTDIFAFNDTAGGQDNDITDGNFPNALAAFKADFG